MNELTNTSEDAQPGFARFMRSFAHELGNPVATIRMSSEMLLGGVPDEMHSQLSQMILDEAIHMELLVEAAVYYASLASSDRTAVALGPLVEQSIARRANDVPTDIDHRSGAGDINADAAQIARLLDESVMNAVQAGASRIRVTTEMSDGVLLLTVADDGEPLPPGSEQERVFDPFFTTREGRLGLGASIARRIAELHGGDAKVGRTANGQVEFTYRIPQNY